MTREFHVINFRCDEDLYTAGVEAIRGELRRYGLENCLIDKGDEVENELGDEFTDMLIAYFHENVDSDKFDIFLHRFASLYGAYLAKKAYRINDVDFQWYIRRSIQTGIQEERDRFRSIKSECSMENIKIILFTSLDYFDYYIGSKNEIGCIVSTFEIKEEYNDPAEIKNTFITGVLHEFGHVFGLPDEQRVPHNIDRNEYPEEYRDEITDFKLAQLELKYPNDIVYCEGPHCLRKCVMRQRYDTRNWGDVLTEDRLSTSDPYCPFCRAKLTLFLITN